MNFILEHAAQNFRDIRLKLSGNVAILTLDPPQKLNALTLDMVGELSKAVEPIKTSDARALIITGAGRASTPALTC